MQGRDIIVVGGSAGALEGVLAITSSLGADVAVCILIVIHSSENSPGVLADLIRMSGPLPARMARDHEVLRKGQIYVAPPNRHMLVKGSRVITTNGPKENNFRPAIDPLFRTAARTHGARVVGVILSGMLDDGVHGLSLIKHHGGVAVVQNPNEALVDSMPTNAIRSVEVDYVLGVSQIGPLITKLGETLVSPRPRRKRARKEREPDIAESGSRSILLDKMDQMGAKTPFTCPECGGALWASQDGRMTLYRCHVGHGFTERALSAGQAGSVELHLWGSIRALEEHAEIHRRMATRKGLSRQRARDLRNQSDEMFRRALILRRIVVEQHGRVPVKTKPATTPRGRRGKGKSSPA
jgi:two-component system, chemotaxis family, protein-glutamate methylesterase/glutaminase